ncbi:MAG: polyisoprenoid-binding protein [Deltaproteobacteria bacterium]|nr:polyisoprenoid-binding protein [Deltaproteobacteria bacterium]
MKKFLSLTIFILGVSFALQAKTFELDKAHSSVNFKIRHLLSSVNGRFKDFKGSFEVDEKTGDLISLEGTIVAASIDTDNGDRDKHLRSADFFNADADGFKELKFVSDKVAIKKGTSGKLPGKMTIHGVTKPVVFNVEFAGEAKDPWGNEKSAFTAKIDKLNRKDFGLNWNKALEAGGVLVGDEVAIELNVEGNLKAAEAKDAKAPSTKKK